MLLEFAESGHPTFRATTPLSRGILKSKGHGKLSIHFAADEPTIETIFRIIISVNQLSIYGAVAAFCEEFENHQDGSGEPEILMGQSVACREYTLPRDDPASKPKGWIQGNMRIGPVLEVTTSFHNGKHGIQIRIWSVGQDNSQSWVRISYGTIKYVINSNQNNTEIPADPQEDQVSQTSVKVIAARSKAKNKTTTERTC